MNRQITLAARPKGLPQESDFALVESEIPKPGPGEVLVRSHWLSLDPYMRGRMDDAKSYSAPQVIGDTMIGGTAGVVEFPEGSAEVLPFFYMSRPTTIGAGTSEIQRIVIARELLGRYPM